MPRLGIRVCVVMSPAISKSSANARSISQRAACSSRAVHCCIPCSNNVCYFPLQVMKIVLCKLASVGTHEVTSAYYRYHCLRINSGKRCWLATWIADAGTCYLGASLHHQRFQSVQEVPGECCSVSSSAPGWRRISDRLFLCRRRYSCGSVNV
jgi:hypothetical protein